MTITTKMKTALLAAAASVGLGMTAAQAAPLFEADPVVSSPADKRGEQGIRLQLREAGFSPEAVAALVETKRHENPATGRLYLQFEQRLLGTPVYGSYVRATIEPDGTLSRLVHRIADLKNLRGELPRMANERAVAMAVGAPFGRGEARIKTQDARRIVFDKGDFYHADPVADRVVLAGEDGSVETGYLVRAWAEEGNELLHTVVDAKGDAVDVEDRTSNDSYIVFKKNPLDGNAVVASGNEADPTGSPRGWLDGSLAQYDRRLRGNNAEVYIDRNGDNSHDWQGNRVWDGKFDALPRLGQKATSSENKRAVAQNLFYQLNKIHDRLYRHGFTETAGNFQKSNFGRGGFGGDHVTGEALDGASTNNANMAVPLNDGTYWGQGPRMQMFVWTRSNPTRAGSFQSDIVWHEYGHGVLWRMVGDLDRPISWAVNEGFADSLALFATGDDRVGEWAANRSHGIRRHRYEGYPYSLNNYRAGKSNAHRNGELFGAAMWKTHQNLKAAGVWKNRRMDLVIDALSNTRPGPDFLDMRDGLLAAAKDREVCPIWKGFAAFGMGKDAVMSWSGTKSSPNVWVRESNKVPSGCDGSGTGTDTGSDDPDGGSGGDSAGSVDLTRSYASAAKTNDGKWYGYMQVRVMDGGEPVGGKELIFDWKDDKKRSCTTNSNGFCSTATWKLGRYHADLAVTVSAKDGTALVGKPTSHTIANPY